MSDRLGRFAPLTGAVFAVLTVVGMTQAGTTPGSGASGARLVAYFTAHRTAQRTGVLVGVLAFAFFMFFAAALRSHLRRTPAVEGLSALAFAGAILLTAGFTLEAGWAYALADRPAELAPAAAQALNMLDQNVFFTAFIGAGTFGLGAGLAILRGADLPKWLGWFAIAIGVAGFTPAIGFSLLTLPLWALLTGIVIYRRTAPARPTAAHSSREAHASPVA